MDLRCFVAVAEKLGKHTQTIMGLVPAELGATHSIPASLDGPAGTGVTSKWLQGGSPLSEVHLVWQRGDDLPALRVFIGVAAQKARAAVSARQGRPLP